MTELESTLHKYLIEEVFHDQQLKGFTSDTPLISSELAVLLHSCKSLPLLSK